VVLMRVRKKTCCKTPHKVTDDPDGDRGAPREEFGGLDLHLAGSIDRVHLGRAIKQLAPCRKVVVELHDIQGYKRKEIAQIMDWSVGNSKAHLHRHASGSVNCCIDASTCYGRPSREQPR
jgi:DNA-directed RNA polymerase specialized sigma24 family protein